MRGGGHVIYLRYAKAQANVELVFIRMRIRKVKIVNAARSNKVAALPYGSFGIQQRIKFSIGSIDQVSIKGQVLIAGIQITGTLRPVGKVQHVFGYGIG